MRSPSLALFSLVFAGRVLAATGEDHKTQNIIFVMTDGLRWEEVFRGADPQLLNKESGGVADVEGLKKLYSRDTSEARRQLLMPFLWGTIANSGQIYGNRDKGSDAYVTNGLNFSYPGYNETLCGFADPRIDSNDKIPNPNVTVFEWLNSRPTFQGKVAAFGAWDVFPFIFNAQRARFEVNAGYDPLYSLPGSARIELVNQIKQDSPRVWSDEAFDVLPFYTALEYLKGRQPRVLYLSLGETDDWAHEGNYTEYLTAAHRVDSYLRQLWEVVQSMPGYRGNTTLIFSPDHGRGESTTSWKSHGEKVPESKFIWMAFLGPDTAPLGERTQVPAVTQSQIAATLAALLGQDYNADVPNSGKPISDVLTH
jgi:Type I phosphodiesterase / nucleotide pyrophosphatase